MASPKGYTDVGDIRNLEVHDPGAHALYGPYKASAPHPLLLPGAARPEPKVGRGLVETYVGIMIGLPLVIFCIGTYTLLKQHQAELDRNTTAPVTYANYVIPPLPEGVKDVEADHIWVTVPALNESHANAVFASNQFWFELGPGGYMGTQVWREGVTDQNLGFLFGGEVAHKVIVSIWDADPQRAAQVGADPTSAGNCHRFDGEGTGVQCSIIYPFLPMQKLTVAVKFVGGGQQGGRAGSLWTGLARNAAGEEHTIGTIFLPDLFGSGENANKGYGWIQPGISNTAFQEYYRASGCARQALSQVGIFGPYFAGRTISPSEVRPKYNDCPFEDVSGCIPGYGCGPPRVLLSAGGAVARGSQPDDNLWAD